MDVAKTVGEFNRLVTAYRTRRRAEDYTAAVRCRGELERAFASYLSPRSRKLQKDFLDVKRTMATLVPPDEKKPVKTGFAAFMDEESDDGDTVELAPFVAPKLVVAKDEAAFSEECDTYGVDVQPVQIGDLDNLEDHTEEYKRINKECIALRDLHMQLADHVESQDEDLMHLDAEFEATKLEQEDGNRELIKTMGNRVLHLRRKCAVTGGGGGLLAGLTVGGTVFSAPVIGLIAGAIGGATTGLAVGQKLRRRWKRREAELISSNPAPENGSILAQAQSQVSRLSPWKEKCSTDEPILSSADTTTS
jgi:hypothetical protein